MSNILLRSEMILEGWKNLHYETKDLCIYNLKADKVFKLIMVMQSSYPPAARRVYSSLIVKQLNPPKSAETASNGVIFL